MAAIPRRLGAHGPLVAPVGYGAMVLEGYYGGVDADLIRSIRG